MKHARLVLSSLALICGLSILGLSLTSAVTSVQSATGSFEASNRRFYVNEEILPDHIAYPALMALDRAKLEAASPRNFALHPFPDENDGLWLTIPLRSRPSTAPYD